MSWFDSLLWPLMVAVAWLMVQFHKGLTLLGLGSASGVTWALSIVGLVIIIRILLIPLFMRQIKAARGMQMLSPELQALQKKYKGRSDPASREAMTRETMDLYKKHGTNPFSSCLPLLAQSPIFFALFRVLNELGRLANGEYARPSIGPLTQELAKEANDATIFNAPISSSFLMEGATTQTKIVAVVLIALMSITTFTTQKQLTQKNMPAAALQGPMAQQQKMLLYILPLVFAISGVNFPLGVLIYWSTTNLWSMGQQFYVIRRNPTPGSEADRLLKERRARKAAKRGIVLEEEKPPAEPDKPKGQRQQPVRKDRARTRPPSGTRPATDGKTGGPASTTGRSGTGARGSATGSAPVSGGAKRPASGGAASGKAGTASGKAGTASGKAGAASGKAGTASAKPGAASGKPSGTGSAGKASTPRPSGSAPTSGTKARGSANTSPSAASAETPSGAARKPRSPKQAPRGGAAPAAPASEGSEEKTSQTMPDAEPQDER